MGSLWKAIFGLIDILFFAAIILAVTLGVGHMLTGSWDMREWNSGSAHVAVAEAEPLPSDIFLTEGVQNA